MAVELLEEMLSSLILPYWTFSDALQNSGKLPLLTSFLSANSFLLGKDTTELAIPAMDPANICWTRDSSSPLGLYHHAFHVLYDSELNGHTGSHSQ